MFRTRIALIATLLLSLLPVALIAQEAEVTFPIAVLALEGSYDAAAGGDSCKLAWESAGTPTLRVTASGGSRFREDLVGGELVTLPDVDDAQGCLFVVDVALPEARRYTVTIEGAELVELASADLEDLEGAVVLPVEMDREGRYALAADDYFDLELEGEDGGLRPIDPGQVPEEPDPDAREPGVEDEQPESTPEDPATPVPSGHDGEVADVHVVLFVSEAVTLVTEEGCQVDTPEQDAVLVATSSSGVFQAKWTPGDDGVQVAAAESPLGEAGCVFERTLRLPGADTYTFSFGDEELAVVPFADLPGEDSALLLAIDREGNRTPEEPVTIAPSATPATTGDPLPEGQHEVVGRVNLWLASPEDAPFGCAAGPTRTGVYPGAQVVVRDGADAIIGYGTLAYSDRSGATVCSFDFTAAVPASAFYVFELGNGHRYVVSSEELELWNWRVFIDAGWR